MACDKKYTVAVVLFDGFTLLDAIGAISPLEGHCTINFYYRETNVAVPSDTENLSICSSRSFEKGRSDHVDIVFVPGGLGTAEAIANEELISFLRCLAERAQWITSVCTGSIVLASAGLLHEFQATTHWHFHDVLELLGAHSVKERVVRDRNRMTGAGITSGIDFGLQLLSLLENPFAAKVRQLIMEYDPSPPHPIAWEDLSVINASISTLEYAMSKKVLLRRITG